MPKVKGIIAGPLLMEFVGGFSNIDSQANIQEVSGSHLSGGIERRAVRGPDVTLYINSTSRFKMGRSQRVKALLDGMVSIQISSVRERKR